MIVAVEPEVTLTGLDQVAPRSELTAQARLVGLKEFETPTLEAVERRRWQLWVVSIIILLGAPALLTIASLSPDVFSAIGLDRSGISIDGFRVLMLILTVVFAGYTAEKEVSLRRLTRMLIDERVLTAALSNRLSEVSALLEAGKAMNSVLELDAVLDIILNSASSLLEADGGSIMLGDDESARTLRAVCVRGNDGAIGAVAHLDEGIAGRVAETREPLLVTGQTRGRKKSTESAMCVPLLHRTQLLGVLNINGSVHRRFTEYDLRALSLFAEQAAAAIANARLYEIEKLHVAELLEGELRKSEFLAAVSHDLRTPLTALIGCTKMLQRDDLSDEHRAEMAAMVDRQAVRLNAMIEALLTAARLEVEEPPLLEPVDLGSLLRELAGEFRLVGREFILSVPTDGCHVDGRADSLRRVFANLIDNAFKHGLVPVRVDVVPRSDNVEVQISDRGDGIPSEDRDRVFERFIRLDQTRGTPGIGLGLSIVQGLVTACGGDVRAEAGPDGKGTVIRVRLRASS